ncbi:MAG: hypothetical protein KDC57_05005 [Saprospiraceae bacterium]|nr:hypothetical protein [Saprospiraceae bacterium]
MTIFNKIRRNQFAGGKVGNYLKYATGEIILVVIGILIALQINNWNEDRKDQKKATEIYTNLLTSLIQDSAEAQRTIELITLSLQTQRELITNDSSPLFTGRSQEETDKTVKAISGAVMSFFPKTGVYELITTNNSMDILKSEKIKSLLINLYDFQYKRYENIDAIIDHKYHYQLGTLIRTKIGQIGEYNSASEFQLVRHADPEKLKEYYTELVAECKDIFGALSTADNYLLQIRASINEVTGLIRLELHSTKG